MVSTILCEVGSCIKAIRHNKNYSLARLAEDCGLTVGYLSDIERGRKIPKLDTLLTIINRLDIDPSDFFKMLERKARVLRSRKAESDDTIIDSIIHETYDLNPKSLQYILDSIVSFKEFIKINECDSIE